VISAATLPCRARFTPFRLQYRKVRRMSSSLMRMIPSYDVVIGPTLTFDGSAILVALHFAQLRAGHARSDALEVGQDGPRALDGQATSNSLLSSMVSTPSLQVLGGVDIGRLPEAGHFSCEFGTSANQRACALVPSEGSNDQISASRRTGWARFPR